MKMNSLSSPTWKTRGGVMSVLGPWIAAALFDDHDDANPDAEGQMTFFWIISTSSGED
jgi:hypothetical protein